MNLTERVKRLAVGAAICAAVAVYFVQQRRAVAVLPPAPPGWTVVHPPEAVDALLHAGDSVWAGGKEGVWRFEAAGGRVLERHDCGQAVSFVHDLLLDREGALWVAHNNGLTRIANGGCTTLTARDGLPDTRVNALLLDRDGQFWAGTQNGLARRTPSGWVTLRRIDGLADDMVFALLQDPSGAIWAGSFVPPQGGLSIIEDGAIRRHTRDNGLPHNGVAAIYGDRSGAVWVGTGLADRGGLSRFVRGRDGWSIDRTFSRADGLPGDKVRSILEDPAGGFWFGTEIDGLARFRDGKVIRVLTKDDGMPDNEATRSLKTPDGALWLGTPAGVVRIGSEALARAGL